MAKVFISYSRKDIDFAKRLTGELQKSELDFWVDWEGIPPTVDWWREVEKGIEEADVFIFLISPDSAVSKVCGQEIDHAVKNGKRLIPLVVRDIKEDETPNQLGHLNWIFFRESDNFDASLKKLLAGIHTDYEWVQSHRRLQVKALEWKRNDKENSFLLRGKDLQDAEFRLATNTSKEPYPTDLQREYVFKSRKATDGQRRTLTSISVMALIIMALITAFALVQLNISRARQMGAQAQVAFAEENYNLALLYAYQSNLIHKNDAADKVLGQLPYKNFASAKGLLGHLEGVDCVAWSADGRLASGSLDNTVILWDLKTGKPAQTLEGHMDDVSSVAWSADGRLASGSRDNTVILWDLKTGKPAQIMKGHTDAVWSVAWSADGRLASGSNDQTVIIWNLETGQPAQVLKGHTDYVVSVDWSSDGRLASGSDDSTIVIWDLKTSQPSQILKGHKDFIKSVFWLPDGRLISSSADNTIKITRADLLGGDICSNLFRNMTIDEWLDTQGILYVYQPACPDLYNPSDYSVSSWLDMAENGLISLGFPKPVVTVVRKLSYFLAMTSIIGALLVDPSSSNFEGILEIVKRLLTTWDGRAMMLISTLVLLGIVYLVVKYVYKLFVWLWYKVRGRRAMAT